MKYEQLELPLFEALEEVKKSADAGCVWCGRFIAWHKSAYEMHQKDFVEINRLRGLLMAHGIEEVATPLVITLDDEEEVEA